MLTGRQAAIEAWGREIEGLVNGTDASNVLPCARPEVGH